MVISIGNIVGAQLSKSKYFPSSGMFYFLLKKCILQLLREVMFIHRTLQRPCRGGLHGPEKVGALCQSTCEYSERALWTRASVWKDAHYSTMSVSL